MPFDKFLKRHIFDPLGMQHSSFSQPLQPALLAKMSKGYNTASDGKRTRAEPMVPLFQSGKVRLVGVHTKLEDQLTGWTGAKGEKSPDRVDSCVWAISPFLGHRLAPPSDDDGDGGYSFVQGSDDWADDYGSGAYSYG